MKKKLILFTLASLLLVGCTGIIKKNEKVAEIVSIKPINEKVFHLENSKITVSFNSEKVYGCAGVNNYFGHYTLNEDGTLKIGPVATTMMMGIPEIMAEEQSFLAFINSANKLEIVNEKEIKISNNEKSLTFRAE